MQEFDLGRRAVIARGLIRELEERRGEFLSVEAQSDGGEWPGRMQLDPSVLAGYCRLVARTQTEKH